MVTSAGSPRATMTLHQLEKQTREYIGTVYCPQKDCENITCVPKMFFPHLERSDYQCLKCACTSQVRNIPFENQTLSFVLLSEPRVYIFEATQKVVQDIIGDVFCPDKKCAHQKCVYVSTCKESQKSCYDCPQCKACSHVLNIPFTDQKPFMTLFGGDGTHVFKKKHREDYEKEEEASRFLKKFLRQSDSTTEEPCPKKAKLDPNMD